MNLSSVVGQLKVERVRAMKEVEKIDSAIRALDSTAGGFKRPLSKEARERIAAAQRERWAKVKGKKNR
jgi:predicted phage tail protein